jgi:hypothetical protein
MLPWLLVLVILELLRIGLTAVGVRRKGPAGPLRPGLPSMGRGVAAWAAVVVLTLFLGWLHLRPEWLESASSGPTVESVLREVDKSLFPEEDRSRKRYRTAVAVTWQGEETPGAAEVDTLGRVSLGRAGIPDSLDWAPACGPWNLGPLIRFELALFAGPWEETFAGGVWTAGSVDAVEDMRRLRFVALDSLGGAPNLNVPVVRGFQALIDETGVPREGLCELDMMLFQAGALLGFEYGDRDGRLRLQRIHHQIDIANVRLRPVLDLRYRNEKGIDVLEGLDFSVPLNDLSPTLGQLVGGSHFTRLRLVEHRGKADGRP